MLKQKQKQNNGWITAAWSFLSSKQWLWLERIHSEQTVYCVILTILPILYSGKCKTVETVKRSIVAMS